MPQSGLFITLFDEKTLALYLARGVYSSHMNPEVNPSSHSHHYNILADYASARGGTHVFFFLKRHIVYAGQVEGSSDHGTFYLNGVHSPLGAATQAPLVWDESRRDLYQPDNEPGTFTRLADGQRKCQPYLILFKDRLGLCGRSILSDELYFELGDYPYPLPTNSISDMSFCTMTPVEVNIALRLMEQTSERFTSTFSETTQLNGNPLPFSPNLGISKLDQADTEAHLEASILANPTLLPPQLRPGESALCRQVPISPYKPSQMDRADVCYYNGDIRNGSIPNVIIELKIGKAGNKELAQVQRYARWLNRRLDKDAKGIRLYLVAPSFSRRLQIPEAYSSQIFPVAFTDSSIDRMS